MIKLFEEFENEKFEAGDRFRCIHPIVFFNVGDIGILSKIEKFNNGVITKEYGDNIVAYTLINKHGINVPLLLNVLKGAFVKINPLKKVFREIDPFGEEEWEEDWKDEINETHELDPFDEEDWDDTTSYFEKGDRLLAKKSRFNSKKIERIVQGNTYWIPNLLRSHQPRGVEVTYYGISEEGKHRPLAVIKGEEMKEYFDKLPPRFNF